MDEFGVETVILAASGAAPEAVALRELLPRPVRRSARCATRARKAPMPVYKAEGIVLRRQAIGEADRTITLFTREYGKLRAVARGTRRTASRLGGRVEPFTYARFCSRGGARWT